MVWGTLAYRVYGMNIFSLLFVGVCVCKCIWLSVSFLCAGVYVLIYCQQEAKLGEGGGCISFPASSMLHSLSSSLPLRSILTSERKGEK